MSKPKSNKVDVEEGSYDMVVKTIADIGTQTVKEFNSDDEVEKKQVILVVELPELSKKEKPVTLTKWATNAASSKSFGGQLMKACGLNPKTADWDDLLGKAFVGTVEHTESGNAKIKNPVPLKKGQKVGRGFIPTSSCYLDENYDAESFESMPEFIQNAMMKSPEFDKVHKKPKGNKAPAKGKSGKKK